MRSLGYWTASAAAIVAAAPAWAIDPVPSIAPPPAWTIAPELPAVDPDKADAPMQFLLMSSQEKVRPAGLENYVQYAAVPQTMAGLQALGNVILPWNTDRTDLVLHKVAIRRGDTVIDLLEAEDITVLRRENNLEKAMLDGIRTVVIPARGLQIGDILHVAFSYNTKAGAIGTKAEEIHPLLPATPVARVERRFLVPDTVSVRWRTSSPTVESEVIDRDGVTEHRFVRINAEPLEIPQNTPPRFATPIIQMSGYGSWGEISDQLRPLFDVARRSPDKSPLMGEADRIAAATSDPDERMLAALRLAQDQVRYVALLLGDGAYTPSTADETWERKFGDCKGKTGLLLALLDRLGIEAEPVLVSNQFNDRLGELLPSLFVFDHVLVRARIGDRSYYLDPTDYGQRTLAELDSTTFRHGLPLREEAKLEALPDIALSVPHREAKLVWNAADGVEGEVPFEATLTLRSSSAALMRARLAAAIDVEAFDTGLKNLLPGVPNDDLVIEEKNPEAPDGSFVVRFTGVAEMDWSPFEGERETRFAFNQSTVDWDAEFDRAEGIGKDWPVLLSGTGYWERMTETVILPNGGEGYSVEATPLEKSFAGSSVRRSVSDEGDRITMVADFKHLKREISAEEARAAEPVLEEISEDYAYIVGPRERKTRRR